MCIPGRFTGLTGRQFTLEGELSISKNGCFFMLRIMLCKSKTRTKIRPETVLENFPLFCPKCKQETLISVKELHTSVIKEPDA